jgi:hypothetical protein
MSILRCKSIVAATLWRSCGSSVFFPQCICNFVSVVEALWKRCGTPTVVGIFNHAPPPWLSVVGQALWNKRAFRLHCSTTLASATTLWCRIEALGTPARHCRSAWQMRCTDWAALGIGALISGVRVRRMIDVAVNSAPLAPLFAMSANPLVCQPLGSLLAFTYVITCVTNCNFFCHRLVPDLLSTVSGIHQALKVHPSKSCSTPNARGYVMRIH